jgi:hypothetical protein
LNCLKWGSHVAKDCKAPKVFTANLADDSSKSIKSGRHVTREERSEDEDDYENDAMYTDGFVKKRQLNMNVAHFVSPIAESSGENSLSSGSEADAPRSASSNGEAGVSVNTNTGEVILHAYMINPSSVHGDGSDSDESSDDNDAQDGDDEESYQYGPE